MCGRKLRARTSPPTLAQLAVRSTVRVLEAWCMMATPAQLRAALVAQVPATLRQQLLDHLMRSGRLYDTVQLRLMDALFVHDTRRLSVRQVRRFYRSRFAQLLCERGSGLHMLLFEDMAWAAAHAQSLAGALRSLGSLVQVSLRGVCTDDMLDSLGRSCHHLQELDVCGSMLSTDAGIRRLCLVTHPSPSSGVVKSVRRLARAACFDCFLDAALDEETTLPARWRAGVLRRARRNPCCATLRRVNVAATAVGVRGLQLLEASAEQACVVHEARGGKRRGFFSARREWTSV